MKYCIQIIVRRSTFTPLALSTIPQRLGGPYKKKKRLGIYWNDKKENKFRMARITTICCSPGFFPLQSSKLLNNLLQPNLAYQGDY